MLFERGDECSKGGKHWGAAPDRGDVPELSRFSEEGACYFDFASLIGGIIDIVLCSDSPRINGSERQVLPVKMGGLLSLALDILSAGTGRTGSGSLGLFGGVGSGLCAGDGVAMSGGVPEAEAVRDVAAPAVLTERDRTPFRSDTISSNSCGLLRRAPYVEAAG